MAQGINKSEIVEFFLVEAGEHIQTINEGLLALESDSENLGVIDEIFRSAHTIKGSAAMLGFDVISKLAHKMEDLLGKIRSREIKPAESIINLLLQSIDTLAGQVENVSAGIEGDKSLIPMFEDLYREFLEASSQAATEVVQKTPKVEEELTLSPVLGLEVIEKKEEIPTLEPQEIQKIQQELPLEEPLQTAKEVESQKTLLKGPPKSLVSAGEKQVVRVNINELNKLMNLVGTLVINRNRLDQQVGYLNKVSTELNFTKGKLLKVIRDFKEKHEFSRIGEWTRGRMGEWENGGEGDSSLPSFFQSPTYSLAGFSELEFDKYDDFNILARSLTEIGSDISEIINQLNNLFEQFDVDSSQIHRATDQLQEGITDMRMVPVGSLFSRFHRPVRDVSREEGKEVVLSTSGEETRLDKTVIEEIADPLMHLVRNAVSHGIEPPEVRGKAGKSKMGTISLSAYQEGSNVIIKVQDDGGGIDPQKLRETAVKKGIKSQTEVDRLSDKEAIQLLFLPGFSTKEKVTSVSGRGVGMDVVKTNISRLNGDIDIKTELGKGTSFFIKLPLTLIIYQALIVRIAKQEFAIPLSSVEETLLLSPDMIHAIAGEEVIRVRDQVLTFVRLSKLLQLPEEETSKQKHIPVVIIGSAEKKIAVKVDELIGREVIVIKSLEDYLKSVKMFSGATISGAGKVRLILDISHLMRVITGQGPAWEPQAGGKESGRAEERKGLNEGVSEYEDIEKSLISSPFHPSAPSRSRILVADDSLSIRKVVSHFLSNAGYDVQVAIDGLDAWQKLNGSYQFDLLITDLEMPKMHGYDLIARIRKEGRTDGSPLRDLPIIVLTSRAGEKHHQKARDLGADEYLVKPFDEKKLLTSVHKLLHDVHATDASQFNF